MTDGLDVVQRRNDEEDILDPTKGLLDLGSAPSNEDFWKMDDDIFKPLMEREESKADSFPQVPANTPSIYSHPTGSRRKSVVGDPSPVTIKSQNPTMPRVVWKPKYSPFKKMIKTFETAMHRLQLFLSGVVIFMLWTLALMMVGRMVSTFFFAFDPVGLDNWRMITNLYNSGSTFQWSFVLFFLALLIAWPIAGLALAILKAKDVKPIVAAIFFPITYLWNLPAMIAHRKKLKEEEQHILQMRATRPDHTMAKFSKPQEEAPKGGHIGGTGSGGGHGRPSWQGGPANTQAFPRAEQGRR